MAQIDLLSALSASRFDRPDVLKRLTAASRGLAELKGVAASMPNQGILISTLGLQEAEDSSAIENIVTTHDELFRDARREQKKFDLRLPRATFRATKTLEQFDFERLPQLNRALVNELAAG